MDDAVSRLISFVTGVVVALALSTPAAARAKSAKVPGDAAAGKAAYAARCAMCHGADAQGTPMAPKLRAVFGKRAASHADQKYSPALKASALQWTPANLDAFLKAPVATVRGTTMMIGVPNAKDRENLIAYLATIPR
jgi:cytochrome c